MQFYPSPPNRGGASAHHQALDVVLLRDRLELVDDRADQVIAGGRSNLTYTLTDGTSEWILRRPPLGHVQATAHDMGREWTAMSAPAFARVAAMTRPSCPEAPVMTASFPVRSMVIIRFRLSYFSSATVTPASPSP